MSFRPVVPLQGYAGWIFLKKTQASQQAAFAGSGAIKRDVDHFTSRIGEIRDADSLIGDRRLLGVALGAFGLQDDIDLRAFIRKVLSEGASAPDSFANRLADKRYLALAKAFGFGPGEAPRTDLPEFAGEISELYQKRQFHVALGESNPELRLVAELGQDIATIMENQTTDKGRWYALMANKGLRKVMETALGLPASLGAIDLDRQLTNFRNAAQRAFGDSSFAQFERGEAQEKLIRLFLARDAMNANQSMSGASAALMLLSAAGNRRA